MANQDYPLTGLFLKGRLRHAMTPREADVLERMICGSERFSRPHVIARRGDLIERSTMLVEGFVLRCINEGSRRHIVSLQVPGDFVDLHGFALKRLDHDVVTIGPTKVAYVEHEALAKVVRDLPHLTRLLWFSTLLDAAIHREWIMSMERLAADGRLAHLLCETWRRLELVGLGDRHGFGLPLTQADLADTCGTTAVHMNRIIRKMRTQNIVDIRSGRISVPDRGVLERTGDFDPAYLYGPGSLAVGREMDQS
ncbi:Crp/Fnr family transcriptional regulator [Croceicoccus sp. F390]|uniref:Crp/Fnr family transcriptional regulator n=1 Tax=Croceicoccus esteveae TaxID=3075597 RepID=A0ABU2ZFE6_9SPHN|nr:Crp/Fnr family transcriptional regulator [Croceicoccus sp. F390]MDT0575308.1 Crp/Fnr family transcriptional regulator [Croceicoccus sp. F390]